MPDWTKPEDYPSVGAHPTVWAWEFLRRNPKYKASYNELHNKITKLKNSYGDKWHNQDKAKIFIPKKPPAKSIEKWWWDCEEAGIKPRQLSLEQHYAERWGLMNMMGNPDQPANQGIRFIPIVTFPRLILKQADSDLFFYEHPTYDGGAVAVAFDDVAMIAFDLNANITPQLKVAKKILTARKDRIQQDDGIEKKKNREDKWQRYLRVLDADALDIGSFEMAENLGFNKERLGKKHPGVEVGKWLEAALYLRDEGYLNILSGSE